MRASAVGVKTLAVAFAAAMALMRSEASASPLNKTIDFTYAVCDEDGTGCLAPIHVHNYFSSKGNVFGFEDATTGHKRAIGEVFTSGNSQAQFKVAGNSIVFNALTNGILLRLIITPSGGRCSVSASATRNGAPVKVGFQIGPCRAYEGNQSM